MDRWVTVREIKPVVVTVHHCTHTTCTHFCTKLQKMCWGPASGQRSIPRCWTVFRFLASLAAIEKLKADATRCLLTEHIHYMQAA